jgi:hypothetical protein
MTDPDPWAPWASVDTAALDAVFALPDFEAQCRALLELAPHASARQLSLLPWDERHEPREFRNARDSWVEERRAQKEEWHGHDDQPLDKAVRQTFEDSVRARDLKAASEALDLLVKMGTAKGVKKAVQAEDDFSKLTACETLMLGAIVHKLRSEPLTTEDEKLLEYVALLDAEVARAGAVESGS